MSVRDRETTELSDEQQQRILAKTAELRSFPRVHFANALFRTVMMEHYGEDITGKVSGDKKAVAYSVIGVLRDLSLVEAKSLDVDMDLREIFDECAEALYEAGLAGDPHGMIYVDDEERMSEWELQSAGPVVPTTLAYVEEVYDISLKDAWENHGSDIVWKNGLAAGESYEWPSGSGKMYPATNIPEQLDELEVA